MDAVRHLLRTLLAQLRTLPGHLRAVPAHVRLLPAYAGGLSGDLRRVPAHLRAVPEQVRAIPGHVRHAAGHLGALPDRVRRLPGRLRALPGRARTAARAHPRRALAAGAAALAVVMLAGIAVARSGGGGDVTLRALATSTTTTTTAPTTTTTPPKGRPPQRAPLTGMTGDFQGRIDRPALIVKIDNVERARPQAGVNQADIVIEEPVEGDLTRLAAIFHSTDAATVGPVRSVRTTDVDLLPLFGRPLFAASGGNADVVRKLHGADVVDIGNEVSGAGFYRNGGRPAPHNLFTSTLALYGKAPESPPPPRPLFSYRGADEPLPAGAIAVGGIALRFGGPEVSRFNWDPASGTWTRSQRGSAHVDTGGRRIAPRNVVVLEIPYDYSGQRGRSVPHGVSTGQGRVVVLTGGRAVEGTWSRPGLGDRLTLTAEGGEPIRLLPGQTFVELVPPGGWSYI